MIHNLSVIASDASPQNANKGLMDLLKLCGLHHLITGLDTGSISCLVKPSTYLQTIAEHYPRDFKLRCGADPYKVLKFWQSFFSIRVNRSWAQDHPCLRGKSPADLKFMLPLVVHEDAVAAGKCCMPAVPIRPVHSLVMGQAGGAPRRGQCLSPIRVAPAVDNAAAPEEVPDQEGRHTRARS